MKLVSGSTKLAVFLRSERVSARWLAAVAGVSAKHVLLLCSGQAEPTRPVMLCIAEALCYVIGRKVEVSDVFALEFTPNERRMRARAG